jgi:hypothetical protein
MTVKSFNLKVKQHKAANPGVTHKEAMAFVKASNYLIESTPEKTKDTHTRRAYYGTIWF